MKRWIDNKDSFKYGWQGNHPADIKVSLELIQGMKPEKLIADKAYDADWLLHYLDSEAIEAVIPPRISRLQQRGMDYIAYKQRNVIERTINKLKDMKEGYEIVSKGYSTIRDISKGSFNLHEAFLDGL